MFSKESEKALSLALEHGEHWEFLLTEELLRSRLLLVEIECNDFDRALLSIPKRSFSGGPDFMR